MGQGGKSGAIVFFTHTQRFVVKTVEESEISSLLHLLDGYSERIKSPTCRIARIIGLFRINPIKQDFIVMENIFSNISDALVFDLKGCSLNRLVPGDFDYSDPPYGKVLKDLNLQESGFKVNLQPSVKDQLILSLSEDFAMLKKYKIIDYSVLVAFYRPTVNCSTRYDIDGIQYVYSIGIIDFLQKYTIRKKLEKCLKKIFFSAEKFSTENPNLYEERISVMMQELIKSGNIINNY